MLGFACGSTTGLNATVFNEVMDCQVRSTPGQSTNVDPGVLYFPGVQCHVITVLCQPDRSPRDLGCRVRCGRRGGFRPWRGTKAAVPSKKVGHKPCRSLPPVKRIVASLWV